MTAGQRQKTGTGAARVSYAAEMFGEIQQVELPFVIGIIANLSGSAERTLSVDERRLLLVTLDNFDSVLAEFSPQVAIPLVRPEGSTEAITLCFRDIEQFTRSGVLALAEQALSDWVDAPERDACLSSITENADLKKLQQTWRGLYHLVSECSQLAAVKVRVLDASRAELAEMLYKPLRLEQSRVFRKLYEEEYGVFGGEPYGLIVVDFAFSHQPFDVDLMRSLAWIGSRAMCPVVTSADCAMFGVGNWEELSQLSDLDQIFSSHAYLEWRALREYEHSRHLVLTIPNTRSDSPVSATSEIYMLTASLATAYASTGSWFLDMQGVSGEAGEALFSSGQCADLATCGFIAVGGSLRSESDDNTRMCTIQRPAKYHDETRTALARIQSLLPVVLSTLEFGRSIKCIMRDRIGAFRSSEDLEQWLSDWLSGYVPNSNSLPDSKAVTTLPLDEARVEVFNPPGLGRMSGAHVVHIYLKPRLPGVEIPSCVHYEMLAHGIIP